MKTEAYIRINANGGIQRVSVMSDDIALTDKFFGQLMEDYVLKVPFGSLATFTEGRFGPAACLFRGKRTTLVAARVNRMRMKTRFSEHEDGLWRPLWRREGGLLLSPEWEFPISQFPAVILANCLSGGQCNYVLLLATDGKDAWRLPTGNVYADCKVCAGDYGVSPFAIPRFIELGMALSHDQWNSDLYEDRGKEWPAWKMEGDKMVQCPPPEGHTLLDYCEKVSTEATSEVVGLISEVPV